MWLPHAHFKCFPLNLGFYTTACHIYQSVWWCFKDRDRKYCATAGDPACFVAHVHFMSLNCTVSIHISDCVWTYGHVHSLSDGPSRGRKPSPVLWNSRQSRFPGGLHRRVYCQVSTFSFLLYYDHILNMHVYLVRSTTKFPWVIYTYNFDELVTIVLFVNMRMKPCGSVII